jgi:hypothetical protein
VGLSDADDLTIGLGNPRSTRVGGSEMSYPALVVLDLFNRARRSWELTLLFHRPNRLVPSLFCRWLISWL